MIEQSIQKAESARQSCH